MTLDANLVASMTGSVATIRSGLVPAPPRVLAAVDNHVGGVDGPASLAADEANRCTRRPMLHAAPG